MSMIKCPECGKEISDKANSCPSCGFTLKEQEPQLHSSKGATKKKGCLIGFLIFIGIIMIGFCSNGNTSSDEGSSQSTSAQAKAVEPVLTVTASELLAAFEQNELKANQTYKNKYIAIQGAVDNIGEDIMGSPYVTLKTGNVILSVQCMLNKSEASKAANLNKGQQIIVQGNCDGKFGNVLIKNCSIK